MHGNRSWKKITQSLKELIKVNVKYNESEKSVLISYEFLKEGFFFKNQ